ncbi:putative entry exclusion protein TrbK-alt [Methylocystis parvus]|uniref:Putative entry exclusion protein TrbK-alt n=1 Tax=Methylocystis parvus TaxID=134 RepID=A0A6B8MDN2_9HYPH|nr:putative entry exclusion protein TrbK-alt [Methylocystis parvus]QGM99872.1 putative entry exclusion protein TrbK-alt [Methylocystis parvus]WBK02294.1 putative entry exclusion protein TrbK-alt [Methylocystis parvus OBBP]
MKIEDWLMPENLGLIALGIVVGGVGLIGVEAACDADVAARSHALPASERIAPTKTSPIDEELLRCAQLPIEQADDPKCRALWAAQRKKFLTPSERRDESGETLDIFPSVPRALEKPSPKLAPTQGSE